LISGPSIKTAVAAQQFGHAAQPGSSDAVHLRVADREAEPVQVSDLRPLVQAVLGAVPARGG
jgi:hypothetical protein